MTRGWSLEDTVAWGGVRLLSWIDEKMDDREERGGTHTRHRLTHVYVLVLSHEDNNNNKCVLYNCSTRSRVDFNLRKTSI
jgi:hypothetical protein